MRDVNTESSQRLLTFHETETETSSPTMFEANSPFTRTEIRGATEARAEAKMKTSVYPGLSLRNSQPVDVPVASNGRPVQTGFKPVNFTPGSFRVLKETGKLVDEHGNRVRVPSTTHLTDNSLQYPEYRGREIEDDNRHHVPGYSGFIRGSKEIAGRTYGETTRRALEVQNAEDPDDAYRRLVCRSPIPSSPTQNRKIEKQPLSDTFVSHIEHGRQNRIPGYTGHVPGLRHSIGSSYGKSTHDIITQHSESPDGLLFATSTQRINASAPGHADTALARHEILLQSNPLPGRQQPVTLPPEMYVPTAVQGNLKYIA